MEATLVTVLTSTVIASIGGIGHAVAWSKSLKDLKKWEAVKRMILGAVAGFLYGLMRVEYGAPDGVVSFISGWFGVDFIESVIARRMGYAGKT